MGKVFTWEELQNGMVPELPAFTEVVSEISSTLKDSPLIGGVICGSVNYGTHDVRSDIDCLVFYNETDRDDMVARMLKLDQFAQDRFVPIEFIQLTPELATTSMQGISPSMAQHIKCSVERGGLIKADPFDIVKLYELDNRAEAISWTRQRIRTLDEGAVHIYDAKREAHFLQRLLEAPIHATRKLLLNSGEFKDDSKLAILALTEELFPELTNPLGRLVTLDITYTELVKSEVRCPSEDNKEYIGNLATIRDNSESVSRYLKRVGQLLEAR